MQCANVMAVVRSPKVRLEVVCVDRAGGSMGVYEETLVSDSRPVERSLCQRMVGHQFSELVFSGSIPDSGLVCRLPRTVSTARGW